MFDGLCRALLVLAAFGVETLQPIEMLGESTLVFRRGRVGGQRNNERFPGATNLEVDRHAGLGPSQRAQPVPFAFEAKLQAVHRRDDVTGPKACPLGGSAGRDSPDLDTSLAIFFEVARRKTEDHTDRRRLFFDNRRGRGRVGEAVSRKQQEAKE